MANSATIEVRDVSVLVDGTVLLPPQSFNVFAGQCAAITGPNGSGKTTLLKVIAAQTKPTTGSVLVNGVIPNEKKGPFRAQVSALLGAPPIARNHTLLEQLTMVAASWGLTVPNATQRASELLGKLGMQAFGQRFVHELSSGQVHTFSLALVLARDFEILIIDEPEQRLDRDRLELVLKYLADLKASGITVLISTHSPELVSQLADVTLALEPNVP